MARKGRIGFDDVQSQVKDERLGEIEISYPLNSPAFTSVYREFLTLNNDGSTTDMKVDGLSSPKEFFIESENNFDIYIASLCFFISAENVIANLNEFGAAPALANGCELIYRTEDAESNAFGASITINNDLLRLSQYQPSFGNLSGTVDRPFLISKVYSNADNGYMPIIRFANFGYEPEYRGGIRLQASKKDRLSFVINDDLSALTISQLFKLDCIAYGFRIRA